LVGERVGVGDEAAHLLRGRRQAGEVERQPADERAPVGLGGGGQPLLLQFRQDEGVDWRPDPAGVRHGQFRQRRPGERLQRPPVEGLALLGGSRCRSREQGGTRRQAQQRGRQRKKPGVLAGKHRRGARGGPKGLGPFYRRLGGGGGASGFSV